MEFFKRKVMYPQRRTAETSRAIDRLFKEYAAHIKAIRDFLPEGARALSNLSFHDAKIEEVKHLSRREVHILIEGGGYDTLDYGGYTLAFSGVRKAWVPYTVVGDTWLYDEMHLSDVAAFDYHVLLVKDEIRIRADDVRLIQRYKGYKPPQQRG